MPPSPFRRKRDDDPFGDLFAQFEKEFARMQEHLNEVFEDALKNADVPKGQAQPGNPFVYGFTMRLGPDGKPRIEPFGSTPGLGKPEVAAEAGGREPITDVIEHEDHFSATVELPGVEREDIQVFGTDDHLTIKVDTATRKYYKEVAFPAPVRPDTTQATFKNGVLDVTVQKRERGKARDPGFRVNVK